MWLTRRWTLAWLLFPPVTSELYHGNVHLLIAIALVAGFRAASVWAFVGLAKVTTGIVALWPALRRDWRALGTLAVTVAIICLPTVVVTPDLWSQWIAHMLVRSAQPNLWGAEIGIPLVLRMAVALGLIVWGVRQDRRWVMALAIPLAMPALWVLSLAILAALPRLRDQSTADPRPPRGSPPAGHPFGVSDALLDPPPSEPATREPAANEPPRAEPSSPERTSSRLGSVRAGEVPIDGPSDEPVTDLGELGGLFSPGRRALTAGLVMTITLVAFEALAVATVMPLVRRELGSLELYGWVFSAFFLGTLIGIVIVGGLIDRGGLVRPFAAGLALFSIGLIVGGLAPSMPVLVAGRFLQGLGAGAIPPIAYVSIGRALPDDLRPRMFAVLSTAWVLPGVIGPAIAGGVAQLTTWRAVFLGLLPLIVAAGAITLPAIRSAVPVGAAAIGGADPDGPGTGLAMRRRVPIGLVLAAGAGLLLAGLTSGSLVLGVPLVVIGLVLVLPSFMRLTPVGTLRAVRGLPAAVLLRGLLTFTFFCADAYVPLALQEWRGLGPAVAGIALTGATLSWTAGAWIQARRIDRWGVRRLVGSGFGVVAVGIVAFALVLSPAVPVAVGIVAWTIAGLGMGLSYSPLSLTVLREATPGAEGTATSSLQLSDVLGTALGTGVGGALLAFSARSGLATWVGLAAAFVTGAAVGLLGFALSGRLEGRRDGGATSGNEARLG